MPYDRREDGANRHTRKARETGDGPSSARKALEVGVAQLKPADQVQALRPAMPLQFKGEAPSAVRSLAAEGVQSASAPLPHLDHIQSAFGSHDVQTIRAQVGGPAESATRQMGASAYATGDRVAFKSSPDLHTAAHEAAHVVQQRQGVDLSGGVGKAGDAYERHADAVADRVVSGRSAEDLLSSAPTNSSSVQKMAEPENAPDGAVQKAPDPKVAELKSKVDADKAAIKAAGTLQTYKTAVAGSKALVNPTSKQKVETRITRLYNSYNRAKPVWNGLPAPEPGKSAEQVYWTDRMTMVEAHLKDQVKPLADAAATALDGLTTPDPKKQMKAEKALAGVIPASGRKINEPETQADVDVARQAGGIVKVFDVGDLFWKMDGALRTQWISAVGASSPEEAQTKYIEQCKTLGKLPMAPPGKENTPPWKGLAVTTLYTAPFRGFVGMGKDAPGVSTYSQAMEVFALNDSWYPSGAMFIVMADESLIIDKINAGELRLGKPSIFCHLEFEEFLYAEHDQSFGELAKLNPDKSPTESFNGVKELVCVGLPANVWGSARYIPPG